MIFHFVPAFGLHDRAGLAPAMLLREKVRGSHSGPVSLSLQCLEGGDDRTVPSDLPP